MVVTSPARTEPGMQDRSVLQGLLMTRASPQRDHFPMGSRFLNWEQPDQHMEMSRCSRGLLLDSKMGSIGAAPVHGNQESDLLDQLPDGEASDGERACDAAGCWKGTDF